MNLKHILVDFTCSVCKYLKLVSLCEKFSLCVEIVGKYSIIGVNLLVKSVFV